MAVVCLDKSCWTKGGWKAQLKNLVGCVLSFSCSFRFGGQNYAEFLSHGAISPFVKDTTGWRESDLPYIDSTRSWSPSGSRYSIEEEINRWFALGLPGSGGDLPPYLPAGWIPGKKRGCQWYQQPDFLTADQCKIKPVLLYGGAGAVLLLLLVARR